MYIDPKNQSLVAKTSKNIRFHHFRVVAQFRFQNVPVRVPFSNLTVSEICRQKVCHFRVDGGPICHIFTVFKICRHRMNAVLGKKIWLVEIGRIILKS